MKVVLDSNVLLSAMISPDGTPAKIHSAWRAKQFEVVTSGHQLDELRRATRYERFRQRSARHQLGRMINNLRLAIVLDRLRITEEADDPEDSFLLAMAVAGDADYLVTGDHRAGLLARGSIGRTRIVTPRAFCEAVL